VAPKIRVLVAGEARAAIMLRHTAAVEAAALAALAAMAYCGMTHSRNSLEALGARVF